MTDRPRPLPLDGIRVLDLGMFWAGPLAGKWLGDAGAEVIKIESASHPDNLRILARGVYPDGVAGERSWNRSGMINERNRNKLGLALEMGKPEGREVFQRLVAISDVVLHNFSTRVLTKWGLDFDALLRINPEIILASIYSQGGEGPESGFVSFGGTLEQLGGLTALNGYPGELPGVLTLQLPDPLGGAMAAGLVVAALRQRRQTGRGVHIDFSQRENVTSMLGSVVLDYQMNARVAEPRGNRHPFMAPHGVYRCDGDDEWIALSVRDDRDWASLCRAISRPDLEADARFATVVARQANQDALDEVLGDWARPKQKHEAMRTLQAWGVPAGAVNTCEDVYADPHLASRSFWEDVQDPDAGLHRYPSRPFQFTRTPLSSRLATPTLGEHNDYVLRDLLKMSDEEVAHLVTTGIVGTEPTEDARSGRL